MVRYDWFPQIKGWPGRTDGDHIFHPNDVNGLAISVEVRTPKDGKPQSDISAQLRDFELRTATFRRSLITMRFGRLPGFGWPPVAEAGGGRRPVHQHDVRRRAVLHRGSCARSFRSTGFADPPLLDVSAASPKPPKPGSTWH